jgi:anti-sigma regulatory factor (Ser/Thr protein kinase)
MTMTRRHAGAGAGDSAGEWRLAGRMLVPCQFRAVKEARDHVARAVVAAGLEALTDDAAMATSEIVTNAILHGSPAGLAVLLEVEAAANAVRVSVADHSDHVPVLRELAADSAEGGRGLHLIDSLAKSWGCRPCDADGFAKVVWAELA